jgi:hypothetical protein
MALFCLGSAGRRHPYAALVRHDHEGDWSVDYSTQLDLDLSALPIDDFEVADQELTVESLTGGPRMASCGGEPHACSFCACPCTCTSR